MRLLLLLLLSPAIALGCSSSDSTGGPSDTSVGDAASDTKTSDAAIDSATTPNTCMTGGGTCGCAGGCAPGFKHGTAAQDNACPQPCDGCGACSEWCCVPDPTTTSDAGDAADAPSDG
jgi:hypothetical protein